MVPSTPLKPSRAALPVSPEVATRIMKSWSSLPASRKLPYAERAAAIYKAFNIDLPDETIDELMVRAYGENFDDAAICPITSLAV